MSPKKDVGVAAAICKVHGGFKQWHGGAKTSLKIECNDRTYFTLRDDNWQFSYVRTDADDAALGLFTLIFLLAIIWMFVATKGAR